ncbi:E3 ubiquitin-protein ligase HOS1-like [Populus alba x Populus x berolinensis]|uniref:E3 ubiquitin-protein ligase HOS1-like n=1 Tax=Populus alba x Populus x berolinensis TaxID=444605 RepID=A0AAD6W8M4_9ROSI|nr:E3 ubiquitin-protein ligase HOS1-like [Populus alba x Populus x berolinensis]
MERNQMNGRVSPSSSTDCGGTARFTASPFQPNYSSRAVQEALEHLASIDLIELCSEAKVERCRATRDLRSCGRYVQYVLNSCSHASLCSECSQRCDICPICRIPIPKTGIRLRPRLYYECIESGLVSKRCDERFQEKEDADNELTTDVQRLYSLFDVALENNLVSLICHYVTDVCMDESAVSSDPVIAFLLDEVVVKDWCKRTFKNIIAELQGIYNLETEEMKTRLSLLLKLSVHLVGISNVLEVLELSFKDSLSAQLHDLQLLQENILKAKQHMEIIAWCVRHHFLENVGSRYSNLSSWRTVVLDRKSAAIKRSWPDVPNQSAESSMQAGSLFIEDALANLEIDQGHMQGKGEESELALLLKDGRLFFRSKLEGFAVCYPFENLRAAADVLFLHGSSDLVLAKQAIFLYYLFDRHWAMPDESWRHIVDDFSATFGITRHSLLESLTFYLLDDHTEAALQEACNILPEISGPSTHPKIAQVLLERKNPETALMVLRWSGHDGSQMVSLNDAVTAVRIRVQCALLTEAFMHQRMLCTKVREKKFKARPPRDASDDLKGECRTWENWVEILVNEICCLCIKNNLVDRMISLPWNLDEEKYLHKCLLDYAFHDPSTTIGSLLVVFYLQRYRYVEAYHVHSKLQGVEQEFISKNSLSEEVLSRMRSASHHRRELAAQSIKLLPKIQQEQLKTGKLSPEIHNTSGEEVEIQERADLPLAQEPKSSSLLISLPADSSLVSQTNNNVTVKPAALKTPPRFGASIKSPHLEMGNYDSSSVLHQRLFSTPERTQKYQVSFNKNFKLDGISTPGIHQGSHMKTTPLKETSRTSLEVLPNSNLHHSLFDEISPEREQNGFPKQLRNTTPPYSHRITANPVAMSGSNNGLPNDKNDRSRNKGSIGDPKDIAWSDREEFIVDEREVNDGLRWRTDETSDEEEEHIPERIVGVGSYAATARRVRRSRFARR